PDHRRPFPVAPALQRRREEPGAPRARAHVRLDPRDDARADRSDGAVRGSRGHAALGAGGIADRVAGRPAARGLMAQPATTLPPGVMSLHVLPADHHDKDWDAI